MPTPRVFEQLNQLINVGLANIYSWLHWVLVAAHGASLVAMSRGCSLVLVLGLLLLRGL